MKCVDEGGLGRKELVACGLGVVLRRKELQPLGPVISRHKLHKRTLCLGAGTVRTIKQYLPAI
jgi:hypothetical protein